MNAISQPVNSGQDGLSTSIGFICIVTAPLWVYGLLFPFPLDFGIENEPLRVIPVLALVIVVQLALIQRLSTGDRFMAGVMVVGFLFKLAAVSAFMFMVARVYDGAADVTVYYGSGWRIIDKFSLTGEC